MHIAFKPRLRIAAALFVAAMAWPSTMRLWFEWTLSPFERAMALSFCGSAPHEVLTHCAVCWTGAAALLLAGILTSAERGAQTTRLVRLD